MQAFEAQPPPLVIGPEGVIHVAGTRVSLDSVVSAFDQGATAEEIVQRYPSLDVTSVYEVIAYMLRHHDTVNRYLAERAKQSTKLQAEVERRFPPQGVRERLMARRTRGAPGSQYAGVVQKLFVGRSCVIKIRGS